MYAASMQNDDWICVAAWHVEAVRPLGTNGGKVCWGLESVHKTVESVWFIGKNNQSVYFYGLNLYAAYVYLTKMKSMIMIYG